MADDQDRNLRATAKKNRIAFKMPSEQWPAEHRDTFKNIRELATRTFDSYSEHVDIWSSDKPWITQTKRRAEWLARRACQLFHQNRNEAGWRFGLENDVLYRFGSEVAWSVACFTHS